MKTLHLCISLCIFFLRISCSSIYTGFGDQYLYGFSTVDASTIFQIAVPPLVAGSDVQIIATTMMNGSDIVWMWADSSNATSRRIVGMNVTTNQFIEGGLIPSTLLKPVAFFFSQNGSLYDSSTNITLVPIWTAGFFEGVTYCKSDNTYYTALSGVVNSFNFGDGTVIQSGALNATPTHGAFVCDYDGNIFYSFTTNTLFQKTEVSNGTVTTMNQTYPGLNTYGMAYSTASPLITTTAPLTTSPLTTAPVITATTNALTTGALTTNGLTTGSVPTPTQGVFIATGGTTPINTVNVVPYQELHTTYFGITITGVNNTKPIGIWYNSAFSQNFMFYVNPGDYKIWFADLTTGMSSSYSDFAINDTFPLVRSFAMTSNGTVYYLSYTTLFDPQQNFSLYVIRDMLQPVSIQLWIRQITPSTKSIAVDPTDQLYFGRTNGQVVSLNGSGFQIAVLTGWPTSFPNLTVGTDRFITFSPNGELVFTPITYPNNTVELAVVNLITSGYFGIRPFPGLMENAWSFFQDTFYYDGPVFGDYTTGVTSGQITTGGLTSGQITTQGPITTHQIQTSGKLTTSPLTTSQLSTGTEPINVRQDRKIAVYTGIFTSLFLGVLLVSSVIFIMFYRNPTGNAPARFKTSVTDSDVEDFDLTKSKKKTHQF